MLQKVLIHNLFWFTFKFKIASGFIARHFCILNLRSTFGALCGISCVTCIFMPYHKLYFPPCIIPQCHLFVINLPLICHISCSDLPLLIKLDCFYNYADWKIEKIFTRSIFDKGYSPFATFYFSPRPPFQHFYFSFLIAPIMI